MSSEYITASEGGPNQFSPGDCSPNTSTAPSRPNSPQGNPPQKRGRVRFGHTSETTDPKPKRSSLRLRDSGSISPLPPLPIPKNTTPSRSRSNSISSLLRFTPDREKENPFADPQLSPVYKPRPSVRRNNSYNGEFRSLEDLTEDNEKAFSALAAQNRAQRVATLVGSHSSPNSRRTSFDEDLSEYETPRQSINGLPVRVDDIPLVEMDRKRYLDGAGFESEENTNEKKRSSTSEAHKLVRAHTRKGPMDTWRKPEPSLASGQVSPEEGYMGGEYVPAPQQYRGGVLSSLLKLYNAPSNAQSVNSLAPLRHTDTDGSETVASLGSSGVTTPRKQAKWYNHKNQSQDTLAGLIEASAILAAPGGVRTAKKSAPSRPGMGKRTHSGRLLETAARTLTGKPRLEDEIRITVHIAETLSRQKYLLKLCRALMSYGAPTHRLEEYMKMTARVLEIDGQFLYIPGCMIISFDDATTHTTEVKLVKAAQGVNLGKLKDVHEIYKEVVHDVIGVEEATQRLDATIRQPQKHAPWVQVIMYGFASASVGPFAFEARLIDTPIAFLLGCLVGFLQLVVAPYSDMYSNVFEISAAIFTSFLARLFGSIRGGDLFCFSALAQSSIALILPGYMVLCGSLELQSRSMVAGSVRMVYAIIFSLFLGFGITIGTAFYGLMDANATSATTCEEPLGDFYKWFFVVPFAFCLAVINQAKWKQLPVMMFIAMAGYIVNFFSAKKFTSSALSNALGALAIGTLGNLYSRIRHGVAATALLPAIFVQVPSGLAASGSLLAGLSTADSITNSSTYANGTAKINGTSSVAVTSSEDLNTIVFNVGYSMIQIAIGISVGLFMSALVVYPRGKRRSGLFSF